jgi:hypothetical protein
MAIIVIRLGKESEIKRQAGIQMFVLFFAKVRQTSDTNK